jgi:hypothetical protein
MAAGPVRKRVRSHTDPRHSPMQRLFFLPQEGGEIEVLTLENIGIFALKAATGH